MLFRSMARAFGEEALTEGPQGAQERLAANLALQREGKDISAMQGVLGQGVQESIIGGLTGAPVAAARGPDIAAQQREAAQRLREEQERLAKEEADRMAQLEAEVGGGTEARKEPYYYEPQQTLPGLEAVQQPEAPAAPEAPVDLRRELRVINQRMDDLRKQAKITPDLSSKIKIGKQFTMLEEAKKELEKQISEQRSEEHTSELQSH